MFQLFWIWKTHICFPNSYALYDHAKGRRTEAVVRRCSVKKDILRNFSKFTGKHLCQNLFCNKVAGPKPATLLKKRLWHRYFHLNFTKVLRTHLLKNTSGGCFWLFWSGVSKSLMWSLSTVLSALSCSLFIMLFVCLEQNIHTNEQ